MQVSTFSSPTLLKMSHRLCCPKKDSGKSHSAYKSWNGTLMKVVELDRFDRVQDYGVCWNDLLGMSRDNHIFQTREWLETWWTHFGENRELLLLAVEDKNEILALAPLMKSTYKLFGVKLRMIEFIGTPASDYQSLILAAESQICARMILDYIKHKSWDCIELKNIPESSETAKELQADPGNSLSLKEREMDVCSFIILPNTFEEYFQKLHRKRRQTFRRDERNLKSKHEVEYASFGNMGLTLEKAMETFFNLHQLRWESRGSQGLFADKKSRDFHMDIARRFRDKGWLRLEFLNIDDEPVSTDYCFEYGLKMYGYLNGFDPRYSDYGVGNVSLLHCIENSIKRGLREFDMLRGDHSYKESWSCQTRKSIELSAVCWKPVPKAYAWFVRSNCMSSLSSRLRKRALSNIIQS